MLFLTQKYSQIERKLRELGVMDIRFAVLIGFAAIGVSVFWSGAKIIQQNYELSIKVEEIRRENEVLELENRNKELQNQYYATDTFAELNARRVQGKAAPGERVYIVPKEVALAALSDIDTVAPTETSEEKPFYQNNIEAWMRIYFGE